MISTDIVLLGSGGHCLSVIEILNSLNIQIAGIVYGNNEKTINLTKFNSLGFDEDLPYIRNRFSHALVTVGQIKTPNIRKKLFNLLCELKFIIPTVISPYAVVSNNSNIGMGSIVFHKAILNSSTFIGNNNIINTGAIIEHNCVVGDHCHISVGAILCGGVNVGCGSFIGAGSIIRENVNIGANVVIGCGSVIRHDVPDNITVRS